MPHPKHNTLGVQDGFNPLMVGDWKSTLHLTKHQEASSSRLGRGGEISPNCLWHSCGGMPACHVHLYISIACLKTYSLLQCLATEQTKLPMHTPTHAATLSMNERCCRYQSQKDAVAEKPLENPTTKSEQVPVTSLESPALTCRSTLPSPSSSKAERTWGMHVRERFQWQTMTAYRI